MTGRQCWQGVVVALPTPFDGDLSVDFDRLQEQVRWLAGEGCHGVTPCGDHGEYQGLSDTERADVVRATVEAAPAGCAVLPGVGAYGSRQARRWAEQALTAGARAVVVPPPTGYPARDGEVIAHYREVADVGLPVVVENNPFDTRVDLRPDLLAAIAETDGIVAVREISGDVRRAHRILDLCPHLDVLAGTGDVLLELMLSGAKGWVGGLPNALPRGSLRLYELCADRALPAALPLYVALHPVLGWDSGRDSVQAVKLGMDLVGRYGGPCRPPRGPLPPADAARVRREMSRALRAGVET